MKSLDSHQTHFYRERVGSIRQGIPHLQTLMFIEMMQVSGIIVWVQVETTLVARELWHRSHLVDTWADLDCIYQHISTFKGCPYIGSQLAVHSTNTPVIVTTIMPTVELKHAKGKTNN